MVTPRWVLVALTLPSLACAEPPQAWTRVVHDQQGVYSIVQADPVTDTCVRVVLRPPYDHEQEPGQPPTQDGEVEVEILGLDEALVFDQATGERVLSDYPDHEVARDCTTVEPPNDYGPPPPKVRGRVEFGDFRNSRDPARPCELSFELTITQGEGAELETYQIFGRELALYDEGCPHPTNFEARYTELDAAYAELNGLGTVVISSWDHTREVCVWARLLASADGLASLSAVEVTGPWAYSGLRVANTGREACVASELLDPNGVDADDSTSAGPLSSSGSVSFRASAMGQTAAGPVDLPCSLDVDLELRGYGEFYWSPEAVKMRAKSVAVAGACD